MIPTVKYWPRTHRFSFPKRWIYDRFWSLENLHNLYPSIPSDGYVVNELIKYCRSLVDLSSAYDYHYYMVADLKGDMFILIFFLYD